MDRKYTLAKNSLNGENMSYKELLDCKNTKT